jgi:hypothetical protein
MVKSISGTRKKRGRGRPPTGALSIHLRVPPADVAAIDSWTARQKDKPSRPEAIRRLVEIGLTAGGRKISVYRASGDDAEE